MKTAKKRNWLKITVVVFLICGVLGTAISAFLFFRNPDQTYASASIQFSFDGAALGVAPDSHRFSIDELGSDEVLDAALEKNGLSSSYTAEQLRDSLIVQGVYPEDIVDQVMSYESLLSFTANRELTVSDYHPTVFSVRLTNEFDPKISRSQLESLLRGIMDAYQDYFYLHYAENLDNSYSSIYSMESYDYPQQLEVLRVAMTQAANYADEMYLREPAFQNGGLGFNDISVRIHNLIDSDMARLEAGITMNALTKDVARLLTQYQYQIRDLSNQLSWQKVRLERLDALIDAYEKNEIIYLSTTDSLTKIDGNSSETYDTLVDNRKTVADEIVGINAQISNYQMLIADITGEPVPEAAAEPTVSVPEEPTTAVDDLTGEETAAAETVAAPAEETTAPEVVPVPEMTEEEIAAAAAAAQEASARQVAALERSISDLSAKLDSVIRDFQSLLQAYNDKELNPDTVTVSRYDYESPSLTSGAFIKNTIKTAGPFCALGMMVCLFLMIQDRRKEEKASV